MRHRIEDDIYPERKCDFFGELLEVIFVLPFALPAVAVVRIVRRKHHHSSLVVEDHPMMDHFGVLTLPRNAMILAVRGNFPCRSGAFGGVTAFTVTAVASAA